MGRIVPIQIAENIFCWVKNCVKRFELLTQYILLLERLELDTVFVPDPSCCLFLSYSIYIYNIEYTIYIYRNIHTLLIIIDTKFIVILIWEQDESRAPTLDYITRLSCCQLAFLFLFIFFEKVFANTLLSCRKWIGRVFCYTNVWIERHSFPI